MNNVASSHKWITRYQESSMDYPSTTQALFALIVMIIVLVFILVYCCWGTFSCHKVESIMGDEGVGVDGVQIDRSSPANAALVILPYHNMIYIGDGQTQQVYQIPLRDDKPPSYGDIFTNYPPVYNSRSTLEGSEQPPTYEECLRNINGFMMNTSHTNLESETDVSTPSSTSVPIPLLISALALKSKASSPALRATSLLAIRSSTSNVNGSQSRSQRNVAISVEPTDSSSYSNPNLLSCDFDPSLSSVTTSNPCISTNNFPKDPARASQ